MNRVRVARPKWVLVLAVGLAGAGLAVNSRPASATDPLARAQKALQRLTFTGHVMLSWTIAGKKDKVGINVEGAKGVLYVNGGKGGVSLVADSKERMVHHPGGDWTLLWPSGLGPGSAPSPTKKYVVRTSAGPVMLGRKTSQVELSHAGVVRERLYLDDATGLVLRREQLDPSGAVRRQVRFDALQIGAKVPVSPPQSSGSSAPKRVKISRLSSAYRVPSGLAGGYERTGTFKSSGTVHALYSDGLYGLSVFEQPGRLDTRSLPAGRAAVAVGGAHGWHWTWAGGDVVLWETGRTVYTAVGDGPYSDLLDAARSLPGDRELSTFGRLRSACHQLLTSLG
jgi:hypothetical protein